MKFGEITKRTLSIHSTFQDFATQQLEEVRFVILPFENQEITKRTQLDGQNFANARRNFTHISQNFIQTKARKFN